ncbi:Diphthamide biosynthesis protein 2 [Papilio xuthus]|uniref:2-(3-amino-3-carboxypropyl)histidine synthase subunit 2 n=1 Tax=Papilio xuthus TaxID=66420 RepID=A0A194Q441_PAPXU|nr:Diphthamide biosynthesis protein 2 [Papilio xuthus]
MANFTIDGKICIERELGVVPTNREFEDFISYFDVLKTCKWISDNNYSKVCLQFPDELLNVSAVIFEEIKNICDVDLYILGDTSYASCCVDAVAAMHVQGDAVIHYGRSCFTKSNIPVFTVLPKKELNLSSSMKTLQDKFDSDKLDKLCLFYDCEFEHYKDEIEKAWYQQYPNSYIAHIEMDENRKRFLGRLIRDVNGEVYNSDVLKNCTCIYIGFSGQTLFIYTISIEAKQWFSLNPETLEIVSKTETAWFKRRRFLIEKCKDANTIGILICKLAGDQTKDIISRLKDLCKVNGKKSYIISVGKPNVAKLANFPEIDIYVMVACPENDLYNYRDFYKPIVYPFELEVALNSNREPYFTSHVTDYDELLPGNKHYCDLNEATETTDVSLITNKIRETKVNSSIESSMELAEKQSMALETIGQNLQERSWKGLEQKLGETEVKKAEEGRQGIPLQYNNEPE